MGPGGPRWGRPLTLPDLRFRGLLSVALTTFPAELEHSIPVFSKIISGSALGADLIRSREWRPKTEAQSQASVPDGASCPVVARPAVPPRRRPARATAEKDEGPPQTVMEWDSRLKHFRGFMAPFYIKKEKAPPTF